MMTRYNPFKPGSIVMPRMFCGHSDEIRAIERCLLQTKLGNPHHFLIHGERGIGKSSLLYLAHCIASGELDPSECGRFKFMTINLELEPNNDYFEIVRKVGAELQRSVADHNKAKELIGAAWDFLKRWEVMGIKYSENQSHQSPNQLLDELTHSLEKTSIALAQELDGIVILIDEADKPSHSANLGEFVKILTERLAKRRCDKVAVGLAGQTTILDRLRLSHESAPRIFNILTLEPLEVSESKEVINRGLAEAREKNAFDVEITPEALELISTLSEGYPHFIQQYAYSAFEIDADKMIDTQDVNAGAECQNGALEQLGSKYFYDLYFDKIGSDEYREVLRVMSDNLGDWVTKDEIRTAARIKESTLNNALKALKSRNIILCKKGNKGVYRLPTRSFAVWIGAYAKSRAGAEPSES